MIITKEKRWTNVNSLNRNQQLYFSSILLSIVALISKVLPYTLITNSIVYTSLAIGLAAIICDGVSIYKFIWNSTLGKAVILLLSVLIANYSFALSAQWINQLVGVDPSKLIYTITFTSILTAPLVFLIACFTLLGPLIVIFQIYIFSAMVINELRNSSKLSKFISSKIEPYAAFTAIVRFIFILGFLFYAFGQSEKVMPKYNKFIDTEINDFIYKYEAFSKSRCQLNEGEKAIMINDNELIKVIKTDDGLYNFTHEKCISNVN